MTLVRNENLFHELVSVFVAAGSIAVCGMVFGYFVSRMAELSVKHSKTVFLETGIQNAVLMIGIILLSFEGILEQKLLVTPVLYTFFIPIVSVGAAFVIFRKLN